MMKNNWKVILVSDDFTQEVIALENVIGWTMNRVEDIKNNPSSKMRELKITYLVE